MLEAATSNGWILLAKFEEGGGAKPGGRVYKEDCSYSRNPHKHPSYTA